MSSSWNNFNVMPKPKRQKFGVKMLMFDSLWMIYARFDFWRDN